MFYFSIQTLILDLQWLIDLGPRPFQSTASQHAAIGIEEKMIAAGWKMDTINLKGNLVGCTGKGHTLFLAHHDTVPNSPGAIDNAAAVATLLEFARNTQATDICIGFPAGEEIGLVGSTQMASFIHKWHPNPDDLRLVVSLELVGQGTLWASGLSQAWTTEQLSWLTRKPHIQSEYAYQIVSRIYPEMERSDHKPFTALNIPTMMLLGRNKDGIFPLYHSPEDIHFDQKTFIPLLETLESLAIESFPSAPNNNTSALIIGSIAFPSWMVWLLNILGITVGVLDHRQLKSSLYTFFLSLIPLTISFLLCISLVSFGLFQSTQEEQTTMNIFGLSDTGWWSAAPFVSTLTIAVFFLSKWRIRTQGSSSLLCSFFALLLLFIDPFLALPMSLAAITSRFWAPFALIGGVYWLQPSILRELTFHGLLPPYLWPILFILLSPCLGNSHVRNRSSHQAQ
jgi:hypothetical protein